MEILRLLGKYGPYINLGIFFSYEFYYYLSGYITIYYYLILCISQFISSIFNVLIEYFIKEDSSGLEETKIIPSSHSQMHASLLTLAYMSNIPFYLILIMGILFLITLIERYIHSISIYKLTTGTLIGFIITRIYWHFIVKPQSKKFKINRT